jgi:hypothetical protein
MIKSSSTSDAEMVFAPALAARTAACRKRYVWMFFLMLVGLMCVPRARSQELEGTLTGTVTDGSGATIANATVTITLNGMTGWSRVVQSNESGNYTASNLPAGTYTVTTAAPHFEISSDHDVVLNVAQKRTVNVQLKIGSEQQTVTVEDNPVTVDTESSSQAGTISGTQVRELELVNRNFQELVTLQPGVVNLLGDQPGFGGLNSVSSISVNGARSTANNWSVDGADINDSGSNSTLLNVPSVDAIQEFTLERSSYDASFWWPHGRDPAPSMVQPMSSCVQRTPTQTTTSITWEVFPVPPITTITSDLLWVALSIFRMRTTPARIRPSSSGRRSGARSRHLRRTT